MLMAYGIVYVSTAVVFLGVDAVWLMLAAQRLYRPLIGDMLLERFNLLPALLFYIIYISGIVIFAVSPAFNTGRWTTATLHGALLGFFAYATYDLTNQATLRNWPVTVTIADLCWGTTLTAFAATAGYVTGRVFANSP
jgi:uncharacterized membrane protein